MVEALIVAGAVLASAAILSYFLTQEDEGIAARRMARTLVRAVEKRGEWDTTIDTEHVKRARVLLHLRRYFDMEDEWLQIIVEEAVFDMEADRGSSRTDTERPGQRAENAEGDGGSRGEQRWGDSGYPEDVTTGFSAQYPIPGWGDHDQPENLPSAEDSG